MTPERTKRQAESRFPFIQVFIDVATVFGASSMAHIVAVGERDMSANYLFASVVGLSIFLVCALGFRKYEVGFSSDKSEGARRVTYSWVVTFALLGVGGVTAEVAGDYSREWYVLWFLFGWVSLVSIATLKQFLLAFAVKRGIGTRSVFVVGRSSSISETVDIPGYKVDAALELSEDRCRNSNLIKNLTQHLNPNHDEVWICLPLEDGGYIKEITYELRHLTVEIRFFPQLDDLRILNHKGTYIGGHYAIDLCCSPLAGTNQMVKRAEDLLVSICLLPIILPVCALIAIAVRVSSPGPVIFKQHRHGLGGTPIKVYKFRTMKHEEGASCSSEVVQAKKRDPRTTGVGAILRRTSLDELPQFYNVLQGRMSIVGPRPHALQHNEYYKDLVQSYMWRHKVKPGITGWAQVNGLRGETDTIEKMEARVKADLWYIENWSLWLDLKIILLTVIKGFMNKNAY